MWLITTDGFYSVVDKGEADGKLTVRARARGDLERLQRFLPEKTKIIRTSDGDYLWRTRVSRDDWIIAAARMAAEIDYGNFKDAVKKRHGAKRAAIYGRVWGVLLSVERGWSRRQRRLDYEWLQERRAMLDPARHWPADDPLKPSAGQPAHLAVGPYEDDLTDSRSVTRSRRKRS